MLAIGLLLARFSIVHAKNEMQAVACIYWPHYAKLKQLQKDSW